MYERNLFFNFAFIFLLFLPSKPNNLMSVEQYVENHWQMAVEEMKRSGIPASITLAQAICESNSGNSPLVLETNNHFGIKCKSNWDGLIHFEYDDDLDKDGQRIKSCFRVYESVEESYKDHTEFLTTSQRYRSLFKFAFYDYKNWANGLQECYYSSNPEYADILIRVIESYGLAKYDDPNLFKEIKAPLVSFEYEIGRSK